MSPELRVLIVKEDNKVIEREILIYTNDSIPDGVEINFLTVDEIVDDLLDRVLCADDKESILNNTTEVLNALCPSIGSFIRNSYGLWLTPHPYAIAKNSSAENYTEIISNDIIKVLKKRLA